MSRYTGDMSRSHPRTTCIAIALVATLASAAPAPVPQAESPPPDWFEVELIVFRHTGPDQSATESWPDAPGRPGVDAAAELEPNGDEVIPFMALPQERSRLVKEWEALKRSPRFEPLGYFAWVQPPFERGAAPAVRIASPAPPAADPALAPTEPPPPPFGGGAGVATIEPAIPALPPLQTPLDGTAALGLQRYLYLTLDLVLLPADLATEFAPLAEGTTFSGFRMTETRRMRSKELHYFDHPQFGVVVLITPRPAPGGL